MSFGHSFVDYEGIRQLLRAIGHPASTADIDDLIVKMFQDFDLNYGIEAAEGWGQQYFADRPDLSFPSHFATVGSAKLTAAGSLSALASNVHEEEAHIRPSPASVESAIQCARHNAIQPEAAVISLQAYELQTDLSTLRVFGSRGVDIITANNFVPSSARGRLSRSYATSPSAVEAHLCKACSSGTGIIISERAASSIPHLNTIPSGLARKKGKISGRLTSNASSNDARKGTYLNSTEVAHKAERMGKNFPPYSHRHCAGSHHASRQIGFTPFGDAMDLRPAWCFLLAQIQSGGRPPHGV